MNTVNLNDLNTGDILLFDERPNGCLWKILDGCIKLCTDSKYSHSAMVLKNPSWLGLPDGIYVWESTGFTHLIDPVDNKKNKFVNLKLDKNGTLSIISMYDGRPAVRGALWPFGGFVRGG